MADSFFEARIEVLEDELEKTKKQLKIAVDGLNSIKDIQFERYLTNNGWFLAVKSMRATVKTALENIEELENERK